MNTKLIAKVLFILMALLFALSGWYLWFVDSSVNAPASVYAYADSIPQSERELIVNSYLRLEKENNDLKDSLRYYKTFYELVQLNYGIEYHVKEEIKEGNRHVISSVDVKQ